MTSHEKGSQTLSEVSSKVHRGRILTSLDPLLSHPLSLQDVRRMAQQLPNLVLDYLVPLADFNHNDFLWAENANRLVYDRILNLFRKF